MGLIITACGMASGVTLVALLIADARWQVLGIWPPKDVWRSRCFWFLFRALNVSALGLATLEFRASVLDDPSRTAAAAFALAAGGLYLIACLNLGRANLYCGTAGLVTTGIYRWSRNPQYALAMAAYGALAIAVQSRGLLALVALLVAVFVLMALAEEPWLDSTYGIEYRQYRAQVSRFYNLRGAARALLAIGSRRPVASELRTDTPPTVTVVKRESVFDGPKPTRRGRHGSDR